jgi:hypothetical protein
MTHRRLLIVALLMLAGVTGCQSWCERNYRSSPPVAAAPAVGYAPCQPCCCPPTTGYTPPVAAAPPPPPPPATQNWGAPRTCPPCGP